LRVRQEADHPILIIESPGLDDAAVIDGGWHKGVGGLSRHQHPPAIGDNQAAIFRESFQCAGVHGDAEQSVARKIKGDAIPCGQDDGPQLGGNPAIIGDMAAEKSHEATIGADRAFVHDRGVAGPRETIAPSHEISVGDVQGGGHEAIDIDLGAGREKHAIGIDQKDISVGGQASKNARGVGPGDPVEGDGAAIGLNKGHRLATRDAEALPVDHDVLAGLGDGERGWSAGDARRPRLHRAAHG